MDNPTPPGIQRGSAEGHRSGVRTEVSSITHQGHISKSTIGYPNENCPNSKPATDTSVNVICIQLSTLFPLHVPSDQGNRSLTIMSRYKSTIMVNGGNGAAGGGGGGSTVGWQIMFSGTCHCPG